MKVGHAKYSFVKQQRAGKHERSFLCDGGTQRQEEVRNSMLVCIRVYNRGTINFLAIRFFKLWLVAPEFFSLLGNNHSTRT